MPPLCLCLYVVNMGFRCFVGAVYVRVMGVASMCNVGVVSARNGGVVCARNGRFPLHG